VDYYPRRSDGYQVEHMASWHHKSTPYRYNGHAFIKRDEEGCVLKTIDFFRNGKEVELKPVAEGMTLASLNRDALWHKQLQQSLQQKMPNLKL
jgi:hypothetical protein